MFLGVPQQRLGSDHETIQLKEGGDGVFELAGRRLDLHDKPMTLELFKILYQEAQRGLSSLDLTERLYGSLADKSQRMSRSLRHNTVKLISRCRRLAESRFGSRFGCKRVRWFPYDPKRQSYSLYEASFAGDLPFGEVDSKQVRIPH
jgi:hypothetical protein